MNRIVRSHFPVEKLPQELREGLAPETRVTVTIEAETQSGNSRSPLTFQDIFAARQPPFRTKEEIDDDLRTDREDWGG
jgi:hypothetical protein